MKTIKNFFSSLGRQEKPSPEQATSDTLMLDIDFLDPKGHWNPKVVLFSKETARERSQSVLVKLFGGIMKLQARRWAENYFEGVLRSDEIKDVESCSKIENFLKNIRSSNKVDRREFYQLATIAMLQSNANPTASIRPPKENLTKNARPGPAFINPDSVTQHSLAEMLTELQKGKAYAEIFGGISKDVISNWITNHVKPPEKEDLLSQLALLTGSPRPNADQTATEKSFSAEGHLSLAEEGDARETTNTALNIDLKDETESEKSHSFTEKKAHEVILQIWMDLPTIRGKKYVDRLYDAAYQSGFLDYCANGLTNPTTEKLDKLFKFIKDYQNDFSRFQITLSESQFKELIGQAKKLIEDIAKERHRIDQFKNTPLFENKKVLTGDDLNDIYWNIEILQNRLQTTDIEKTSTFFAQADWTDFHGDLAEKIKNFATSIDALLLEKSNISDERRKFFVQACKHLHDLTSAFIAKAKSSTDAEREKADIWFKSLLNRVPFIFSDDGPKEAAHITLTRKFFGFNQIRNGEASLPLALENLMNSGFLSYCLDGYRHLASLNIDHLDRLELMAKDSEETWSGLKEFLTNDQLSEIQLRRQELIREITKSRSDPEHQEKRSRMKTGKKLPTTNSTANTARNKTMQNDHPTDHSIADSDPPYQPDKAFNQSMRDQLAEANALIERLSKKH